MRTNVDRHFEAPTRGLNAVDNIMSMNPKDALVLDNWIAYPDAIQTRPGNENHVTGALSPIKRLWNYADSAGEELFATSDTGVYNVTTAGALPAASIALTNGATSATIIATGANNYLNIVNGTNNLAQYDGTTWSSIPAFGGSNSSDFSYVETYNQRLFFIRKNTLTIEYLAINSVSGAATAYDLGAIFRRGGYLVALGTWTLDGGTGSDDQLVAVTSMGEVAVFSGSDPSTAATWTKRGVYYIGKPIGGNQCLLKYGGDLLFISEVGIFPMSKAVQALAIDFTQSISERIHPMISALAALYGSTDGWQLVFQPNIPVIILNIPSLPLHVQFCMYAGSARGGAAWSSFSGWEANCFGLLDGNLYFGTDNGVQLVTGAADVGANITATCLTAYQQMGSARNKRITAMLPYFQPIASFNYILALANDFQSDTTGAVIYPSASTSLSFWGTAIFGTSYWSSVNTVLQDWRAPVDNSASWKAAYVQVTGKTSAVRYLGAETKTVYSKGMGY
jgi:hypothetical protein